MFKSGPKLTLTRRIAAPLWLRLGAPFFALLFAMLLAGVVVALMGKSPARALQVYFLDPLGDVYGLEEIAVKAAPLVMIAIGLIFCFRANLWNIGAEGQFVIGGAFGGWIGLLTHDGAGQGIFGSFWVLPTMLIVAMLAGAAYALIAAALKVWLDVSEILTSLMLVYVAQLVLDYLVRGPWRDPQGFNFPVTVNFDPVASLPMLFGSSRLHAGVLLALICVILAQVTFSRSLFGYKILLFGHSPRAARFAGFDEKRLTLAVFAISGALAGLAGICEVSGQIGQLQPNISPGYGFTAIIVAYLGRLAPIGILIAGLVLAVTYIGGEAAQISMKLSFDMTRTFQGLLLIGILMADVVSNYHIRLTWKGTP